MPNHLKALVSVIALIAGAVMFYFDTQAGAGGSRWIALALGPLAVTAIWIFPEANAKAIRKEAAGRR